MVIWPEPHNGSFQRIKASNRTLRDQLQQQLTQAEQRQRGLLEVVLREALAGRLPERPERSHAAV
jgi:hypothetical protein